MIPFLLKILPNGRYPFITFEGIDGSGKSTIAKAICEKSNGAYFKSPPPPLDSIRSAIDCIAPLQTDLLYFLLGNKLVSDQVEKTIVDTPAICDRYYHTSMAHHLAMGLEFKSVLETTRVFSCLMPDLVICVDCTDELEVKRRLDERGRNRNDEFFESKQKELRRFYHIFPEIRWLDTADLSINEGTEAAEQLIMSELYR